MIFSKKANQLYHLFFCTLLLGSNALVGTIYSSERGKQLKITSLEGVKKREGSNIKKLLKEHATLIMSTTLFLLVVVAAVWGVMSKKNSGVKDANPPLPPLDPVEKRRQEIMAKFRDRMFSKALHYSAILYEEYAKNKEGNMSESLRKYIKNHYDHIKKADVLWEKVKKAEDIFKKTINSLAIEAMNENLIKEHREPFVGDLLSFAEVNIDHPRLIRKEIIKEYNTLYDSGWSEASYLIKQSAKKAFQKNADLLKHYQDKTDYLEEILCNRLYTISQKVYRFVKEYIEMLYDEIRGLIAAKLGILKSAVDGKALKLAVHAPIIQWNIKEIAEQVRKNNEKILLASSTKPIKSLEGDFSIDCFLEENLKEYIKECYTLFLNIYLCDDPGPFYLNKATNSFKPNDPSIAYDPALHDNTMSVTINDSEKADYLLAYYHLISFDYISTITGLKSSIGKIRATFKNHKRNKLLKPRSNLWGLPMKKKRRKRKED